MNGRVTEEMTEAKKEARTARSAANLIGTATGTKEATGNQRQRQGQGQGARSKPDTAMIEASKGISA